MDGSKALSSFFFLLFSTAHTGSCTLNSFSIDPLDQALGNVCNYYKFYKAQTNKGETGLYFENDEKIC